ncbi:MAG: hypothetical protein QME81_10765 [bacterium]|nr:hypothetical protein [bacterium]
MQIKKVFKSRGSLMMALFFAAVFGVVSTPRSSFAEMTVDTYCQIAGQSMQLAASNLQELTSVANQYQNDPEILAEKEELKRGEFAQAWEDLYNSFKTTGEEYILYMGKHSKEVKAYLKAHPEIQQQIDDLAAQINSALEQYELLKGNIAPTE